MRKPLIAALAAMLFVSACGAARESRLNPFNWFGRSEQVAVTAAEEARPLVAQVLTLAVEPTADGAIVRATGLPPTQGWWEGELTPYETGRADEIAYRFEISAPPDLDQRRISTPQSREVTVAAYLSDFRLEGVRSITVTGAQNARTTSRR